MTAPQFLDLVRRSQLVNDEKLRDFRNLPSEANDLAAAMVEAGRLTKWQADKLLAGKYKGFVLGDYTILRQLGKAGLSQEYVAEHTLMKHKVVLTVASLRLAADPTALQRFGTEGGAGQLHQHGNIYFVVRRFIEGLDEEQ